MIRRLVRLSVHRPVSVLMAFLALCVLGAIAWVRIPLQMMPDGFVLPMLWVWVEYPNATPQETEERVVRPVEEQLATITGLSGLSSEAESDGGEFELHFGRDVAMDAAYNDVVDRMERALAELPSEVDRYWVWRWNPADEPIVWAGVSLPEGIDDPYWTLTQIVQKRVERVPGVGKVEAWGAPPKRVAIDLDYDEMVRSRVSIYSLIERLASDNFQLATGRLTDRGKVRYVRSLARWRDVDELRALPVQTGIRLGDLAHVELRPFEDKSINHINGQEGAAIAVYKESGANTVETAEATLEAFRALEQDARLLGARFYTFFSQGKLIRQSLDSVLESAFEGGVFAILILLLFLRQVRMTLLIAACIPFALLITVTVLQMTGQSLNIISLMGLMLSVGMVVDNAIVVVESIYLRRQAGEEARSAAVEGTSEVGLAIVLSTMTSMVVFLPVILMSGDAMFSFFMGALGFPVVFALLASLLVALVFTPLTTTLLKGGRLLPEPGWSRWLTAAYQRGLRRVLARRSDSGMGVLAMLVLTLVIPARAVSCQDEADGNLNDFVLRYEVSGNLSQEERLQIVNTVEGFVEDNRDRWGVEVHRSRMSSDSNRGRTWVTLAEDPPEGALDRDAVLEDAKSKLPDLPGVRLTVGRGEGGEQNTTLSLALRGEDTTTLSQLSEEVRRRLEGVPGVLDVHSDIESSGQREVRLRMDRDASVRQGLDALDVGQTVGFALRGTRLPPLVLPDREVEVRAALEDAEHTELGELLEVPLASRAGLVPLRAVVKPEIGAGYGEINREQRQTAWPMTIDLDTKIGMEDLRGRVSVALDSMAFPRGYGWDWGWRDRDEEQDNAALLLALALGVVFVFVIMGVLFESFLLPLAIITTIPMALVGVYWTLHLTDTPLDVMGGIGLVVLVGVVVNNGIVLLDQVTRRRAEGLDRTEALVEAGGRRLRPILMTALTTIAGLIPMAVGSDTVVGIPYAPLGRVVAGGLVAGTLLTLFFLPYLYAVLDDMRGSGRRWFAWVAGRAPARRIG